VVIKVK